MRSILFVRPTGEVGHMLCAGRSARYAREGGRGSLEVVELDARIQMGCKIVEVLDKFGDIIVHNVMYNTRQT